MASIAVAASTVATNAAAKALRATSAIDAPSCRLSSTIWRFSSRFQDRRLRPTGAKSPSLPTAICLGVHHQIVDTIIEPLFRQLSRTSRSTPGGGGERDIIQKGMELSPEEGL